MEVLEGMNLVSKEMPVVFGSWHLQVYFFNALYCASLVERNLDYEPYNTNKVIH